MHAYFERFGGIRDYLDGVVDDARQTGYTETTLGRRRYLPDLTSDNRQRREMAERMALNAPIQGSAADVIKVAMLNVERAIAAEGLRSRMVLQVHDELVLEVRPGERDAARGAGPPGDGRRRRSLGRARGLGRLRRELGRRGPLTVTRDRDLDLAALSSSGADECGLRGTRRLVLRSRCHGRSVPRSRGRRR